MVAPERTITAVRDEHGRRKNDGVASLYVALDCEDLQAASSRHALAGIDEVVIGRADRRSTHRGVERGTAVLTLGFLDPWLSSTHARLSRVLGTWMLEDAKSKNGTLLNGAPVQRAQLHDGDVIEAGHVFFVFRAFEPASGETPAADLGGADLPQLAPGLGTLVPRLAERFAQVARIAPSNVAVMVHGESGTGKELVARGVHQISGRQGAFVAVNCGSLPPALVESELFGHKKGAFSGADEDRPGLVRASHRGTLFLDEIGDLPVASQPAFLRVLQEREVVPVGATRPVPVDLRLVSATHRDLDALVAEGKFRADLLARLRGLALTLPALRERREEIGMILWDLLTRLYPDRARNLRLSVEAARGVVFHDWPFNVRELEKCLGAAVVLAGENRIEAEHLFGGARRGLDVDSGSLDEARAEEEQESEGPVRPLSAAELQHKDELSAHLREHGGNISAVARAMGKARIQIQRWIKRYRIDPESFRH